MTRALGTSPIILLALAMPVSAQFFQESFESPPGATYTLSNQFDDGSFDFFDRYSVPDNSNAARDDFQNGWDGQWGILGQDHDGDGFDVTQSIDIGGIDITGRSNLQVIVSLGALDSEPAFDNYEAVDGDGIEIFASVDLQPAVLIGRFAPPELGGAGTANAGDLYLDTDLDGVGDGARLTVDLADFKFPVGSTGGVLDLSIELTSTSSFEPLAVDNVRVTPEPSSFALIAGGMVLVLAYGWRRR